MMRFGLAVALLAIFCVAGIQGQEKTDLGGKWERWIGDTLHDEVSVPSSYRPIGTVVLRRRVDLDLVPGGRRMLLRFEGIAHHAEVSMNGSGVGSLGPWTPYDLDVTDQVRAGANQLDVEVTDWQTALGPIGAWEAYGGIIRPVHLETRSDPYIENARLRYKLNSSFDLAQGNLEVFVKSTAAVRARLAAQVRKAGRLVWESSKEVEIQPGSSTVPVEFELKAPDLWSPETPHLYALEVRLNSPRGEDAFSVDTGFRDLKIDGDRFLLNGRNLVLRGVCRHDIWKDQGHTMTEAQIDQDLSMIKATGANFVRLVHYPHNKRVIDAANRIGLLVTEESGLVWLDFRKISRETLETGLSNLERAIKRDWNSPALFAVLLANESSPTLEAIQEGRRRVRAIAPDLFMSSARVDSPDGTPAGSKRLFDEGGLDFYTDHTYGYDMRMFERSVETYPAKPVVFTEWGGRAIGQSPALMKETTDQIGRLVEQGRLAGHAFWSWADLPEFSRQDSEMEGGILKSGIVEEDRTPRPDVYLALMNLFRRLPREGEAPPREPKLMRPATAPLSSKSEFSPVSLQAAVDDPTQQQAWAELEKLIEEFFKRQGFTSRHWEESGKRFWLWNAPQFKLGSIPFATPLKDGLTQPLVISPARPKVEIPVGAQASRLHFLGNVTLPDGYPIIGKPGGRVGRYVIVYEDGERQEAPLRWGMEIARSNMISVATRIDPSTANGERVIVFEKDPVREVHQARLLSVDTRPKRIAKVVCELDIAPESGIAPPGSMHHSLEGMGVTQQALVLFAITAER